MSDPSPSSHFRGLFEAALQDYEKQTGTALADHPFAEQLQECHSVDAINAVLQEQTRGFTDFRGDGKITKSLKITVSILYALSTNTALSEGVGTPYPPAKAIFAGIAILLAAIKDVSASYDALVDLLESIEHFLRRLQIYTQIPPTGAMSEVIIKIMVELLSTLALVTKQVKQKRPMKLLKKLLGERDVEAVLQRLDRLTHEEAQTTAAQTMEVVYGLVQNMTVVMDDGRASIDTVQVVLETIQQMTSEENKSKREELQRDIRNWLSPPDPWKNHNLACKSRHGKTSAWFVQGENFSEWKSSSPGSLLWVHGKPGAGKSVLCSTIIREIDAMRKAGLASLAFFYCDFREDQKKDLRGLVSSLLVQLCHQSDSYCDILSELYSEHARGKRHPSDDALVECLKNLLKLPGHSPVYLIIDALDECSNTSSIPSPRDEVLTLVDGLVRSKLPSLRICVTSRPEADIKVVLGPLASHSVSLHTERGQNQDIETYIRSVVETDIKIRRWKLEYKQLVIDTLIRRADGMFRWVYCQLVYLRNCLPGSLRQAFGELPETLDETYMRTLREIETTNWGFAHRLLQCVAVASRPLFVEELAEFLAFDFKAGTTPKFHEDWRLDDPVEAVLSTCSTLLAVVQVYGRDRVVQFSHFSVKEFLMSARLAESIDITCRRYHISMTPAHTLVTQACLGILLHLDKDVTRDSLQNFSLAKYAAEHWVDHMRFDGVLPNAEDGLKQLFDPSKPHLTVSVWIHRPTWPPSSNFSRGPRSARPVRLRGTHLHYAALYGFHTLIQSLIVKHSQDVDFGGFSDDSTALHIASWKGEVEVARALLEGGANPTALDKVGQTPLHLVASSEHGKPEVVQMLLKGGANPAAQDKDGRTLLHLVASSQHGKPEVAQALLEGGANPTAQDKHGQTPLHLVASSLHGKPEVAQVLLKGGANPTAQDKQGQTPLRLVALSQYGKSEVAQVLLKGGANATAQDKHGRTPLHLVASPGFVFGIGMARVAQVLLEGGANPTAQDKHGQTPLHLVASSKYGNLEVAQVLLEGGANPTAQDKHGQTPLHLVASSEHGRPEVAQALLKGGANVTAQDKYGRTPLHLVASSEHGRPEVAQVLLKGGANPTAQDKHGQTPLHLVASSNHGKPEVAQVLLEGGANVTAQDKDGRTPLHVMASSEHEQAKLAQVLLGGVSATSQDKDGRTPLHEASRYGQLRVAWMLLKRGTNATSQDKDGRTPLHEASRYGHEEVARTLLKDGADGTAKDKDGWTPLHDASQYGQMGVTLALLKGGADAAAQDKDRKTPLHIASQYGHVEVARVLLEAGTYAPALDKDGRTPLHLVASSKFGQVEVAQVLLEGGANPTAQDKDGQTPLMVVASSEHGNATLARVLLEGGANPTAQDKDGRTPLHLIASSKFGKVEVAQVLLEGGANPTAQDKDGQTPLHLVASSEHGKAKLARVLLERGANVTAEDKDGRTPLHEASRCGQLSVAWMLLKRGRNVTSQDKDGRTPLHEASRCGHERVARKLLEDGADATAHDKAGGTSLHLASQYGHVDVSRMLLEGGAYATAQDEENWTPLHFASLNGFVEVTRTLLESGADTTAQNKAGQTPLEVASLKKHYHVVALLSNHEVTSGAGTTITRWRRGWGAFWV